MNAFIPYRKRLLACSAMTALLSVVALPSHAQSFGNIIAPMERGVSVTAIRVEGAQRLETETVLSHLSLAVGDSVTDDKLSESLRSLYATGLFSDASLRLDDSVLVVSILENPIINRVAFEGNAMVSTDDLEKEVQLKPRHVYTLSTVQQDVKRILDLYRRSGRFAATVEPKLVQLDQNRVDLVFEIAEGDHTGVRRISFIGNEKFDEADLRSAINTRESAWWRLLSNSDFYDPDRLNYDQDLLRRFYFNEGYIDFRVLSAVAELTPDREDFFLTFSVEEGQRYKFGRVDINNAIKGLDTEPLAKIMTVHEGAWYSAKDVEKTIALLTAALGDEQYAFAEIVPNARRNKDTLSVDITFDIKEGKRIYIDQVNIKGNTSTIDKVIRREMEVVDGDPYNMSKVRRSEQRIKDLGYFDTVKVETRDGAQPDQANIDVTVKEKATGEISFGAGFSTTDGPIGDFSIHESNFMGRGQDMRLGATVSGSTKQFNFSFTEPYFLDRDLAAGIDLFHTRSDNQTYSSYDERDTGFSLRLGYPLAPTVRQRMSYTLKEMQIANVDPSASRFVREQSGRSLSSVLGQELTYDERDSRLKPTKGFVVRVNTDFAGAGGDHKFLRGKLGYTQYYSIADDYVLSMMGEGGYIKGLNQDVRISDRFFLGGDTLRGFSYAGIGPRDMTGDSDDALGGNRYVRASAELSFPLPIPSDFGFTGHAFTDAATLGDVDAQPLAGETFMKNESIRASVGVGVSWQSPLGLMRLDLSKALKKEDYDKTEILHFSFGTRF